jgi:hypothetical protein
VLEKFFDIDLAALDEKEFEFGFRSYLSACLIREWKENRERLSKLNLSQDQLDHYFIESQEMLNNFVEKFSKRLKEQIKKTNDFKQAFKALVPSVEEEIINHELMVRGFIDAIHSEDDNIVIMDYKTSNKEDLTPEYKLQLGIYALLYKLKYDKMPSQVGINFLKYGEKTMQVDDIFLNQVKQEILLVHKSTESQNIDDYPKKTSNLCKWGSGECDFYQNCMKEN